MKHVNDTACFRRRARQANDLAARVTLTEVRNTHLAMASRYADLAGTAQAKPERLRLRTLLPG